jgi:hypothetical protein
MAPGARSGRRLAFGLASSCVWKGLRPPARDILSVNFRALDQTPLPTDGEPSRPTFLGVIKIVAVVIPVDLWFGVGVALALPGIQVILAARRLARQGEVVRPGIGRTETSGSARGKTFPFR